MLNLALSMRMRSIKLVTFIVIITLLCQNVVWAKEIHHLAPSHRQRTDNLYRVLGEAQNPHRAWESHRGDGTQEKKDPVGISWIQTPRNKRDKERIPYYNENYLWGYTNGNGKRVFTFRPEEVKGAILDHPDTLSFDVEIEKIKIHVCADGKWKEIENIENILEIAIKKAIERAKEMGFSVRLPNKLVIPFLFQSPKIAGDDLDNGLLGVNRIVFDIYKIHKRARGLTTGKIRQFIQFLFEHELIHEITQKDEEIDPFLFLCDLARLRDMWSDELYFTVRLFFTEIVDFKEVVEKLRYGGRNVKPVFTRKCDYVKVTVPLEKLDIGEIKKIDYKKYTFKDLFGSITNLECGKMYIVGRTSYGLDELMQRIKIPSNEKTKGVSRDHFAIYISEDGCMNIFDLGTKNKTGVKKIVDREDSITPIAVPPDRKPDSANPIRPVKEEREEVGKIHIRDRNGRGLGVELDVNIELDEYGSAEILLPLEKDITYCGYMRGEKLNIDDLDRPDNRALIPYIKQAEEMGRKNFKDEEKRLDAIIKLTRKALGHGRRILLGKRYTRELDKLVEQYIGKEVGIGVFIEAKRGVCRHYAYLFYALARAAGMQVAHVRGWWGGHDSKHAWNEVRLYDGRFFYVDVFNGEKIGPDDEEEREKFEAKEEETYLCPPQLLDDAQANVSFLREEGEVNYKMHIQYGFAQANSNVTIQDTLQASWSSLDRRYLGTYRVVYVTDPKHGKKGKYIAEPIPYEEPDDEGYDPDSEEMCVVIDFADELEIDLDTLGIQVELDRGV